MKIAFIVAATAVPAFGVGWTASTMAHPRLAEANAVISPTTISPYDMQLNVKPHDLPVQYMQGDLDCVLGDPSFLFSVHRQVCDPRHKVRGRQTVRHCLRPRLMPEGRTPRPCPATVWAGLFIPRR